jgi:hypothetical protein
MLLKTSALEWHLPSGVQETSTTFHDIVCGHIYVLEDLLALPSLVKI